MKKLMAIIVFLSSCLYTFAQDTKKKDLKELIETLQLNSSPGYVVIGVEPENIQRPNSPSAFIAGVQSAIVNGKMQPNFAMETTPYYWGKKKRQQFDPTEFLFGNNYVDNMLKSATFSFATSSSDSAVFGKLQPGTAVGLGFHVQLVQGKASAKTRENLFHWYQATYAAVVFDNLIASLKMKAEAIDFDTWIDDFFTKGSFKSINTAGKQAIKDYLKSKLTQYNLTSKDIEALIAIKDKI